MIEPTEEEIVSEASFIEMKAYVKYCVYFGYSREEISEALKNVGWQDNEVSEAFATLKVPAAFNKNIQKKPQLETPKPLIAPIPDLETPKPSF